YIAMAVGNKSEIQQNVEKDEEAVGMGSIHEEFKEFDEVKSLIDSLKDVYDDQIALEMSCERITLIVDKYQEQPHLLDPHLEYILNQLLSIARADSSPPALMHQAFKYLYLITKTRGYKVILRLMPHEVADLEPVLALLAQQDPLGFQTWETRYMLLLWLSIVCMIPFDMNRLDSNIEQQSGQKRAPIMDRILEAGKKYLCVFDKSQDAAAYLVSRFLTRPDVKEKRLPDFLDWALVTMKDANVSTMLGAHSLTGTLKTLALLFKQGKREDLIPHAPVILERLGTLNLREANNTVLRKMGVKLVQRMGLIFLKARIAAWRYQRGSRSIAGNLTKAAPTNEAKDKAINDEEDDEDYEIPDEIEEVIELLLLGLKDKDTIVRWSAAKGVGRLTGRLPRELADEVVESVLELFSIGETDAAWHGGCLALAELGRRGLLLPSRLPTVVPIVLKALAYDAKRGNFSVGTHVRDGACYVSWAFARAYEPDDLKLYVQQIASALLIASIFDREVNVRRAASAAFQENVGRQGTFPHGIDILTTADYYAVGNRVHCYQDLSVFVAGFAEYTTALIDHLVDVKIHHWDMVIRDLAGSALHNLVPAAPEYIINNALPKLVPMAVSIDLCTRHGSVVAIAETIHALAKLAWKDNRKIEEMVDSAVLDEIRDITSKLHDAQLFRGLGGEIMRRGVCCLINKLSLSRVPYHGQPVIGIWQDLIDDCLCHIEPEIRAVAVAAIPAFTTQYYLTKDGTAIPDIQEKVIRKYLHGLQGNVEISRQGISKAIGSLPRFMLTGKLKAVLTGLVQVTTARNKAEQSWAEARRDAVTSLANVCLTVGIEKNGSPSDVLCEQNVLEIYDAFLVAMKDYSLDSRGDAGAWVREAAMTALHDLTSLLASNEPCLFTQEMCTQVFCSLVQQCSEKIDRTRAHAGEIFQKLLYHKPPLAFIPHEQELHKIFPRTEVEFLNWASPASTFPLFTQLLSLSTYRYHILLGLTVSVGGLTESLVKHSSHSLQLYMRNITESEEEMTTFLKAVLQVFKDYQKVDRVSIPMFKMVDQLLSNGMLDIFIETDSHPLIFELLTLSKAEISKSGDPQKLMASVDVFSGLLQFTGDIRKKTLTQLVVLLCHKYPRVRKVTANKLYESLLTYDDVIDNQDEVMMTLSETNWDDELDVVRPIRNQLCELMSIPTPKLIKKAAVPASPN
ncbi:unnamed protein product, partial [Owenia fusiformis]